MSLVRPCFKIHTSLSIPPSTVKISRMRADDVVRYARWLSELMRGSVDVQSKARRSYRAVVMPTDALLTLGMLKLTSLILSAAKTILEGTMKYEEEGTQPTSSRSSEDGCARQ